MSTRSVGIYLGEKYSVVAFKDATVRVISTGPNNEDLCRSCVALDRSGQFIVGNAPYKSWRRYAPNIVVSIRRLMGASISDSQIQMMKKDKEMYMNYLRAKFERLKDGSNPIGIQVGRMDGTNDFALLLHQGAYNQSLLITITENNGRITSMRMSEYNV